MTLALKCDKIKISVLLRKKGMVLEMNKKILSTFIVFTMLANLVLGNTVGFEHNLILPAATPYTDKSSEAVNVRLMARDNSSWNNHNPYMSESIAITPDSGPYTLKIDNIDAFSLVDLALKEENSNFCTGETSNCYGRNDCFFALSKKYPPSWSYYTSIKYESVIINGNIDALAAPVNMWAAEWDWVKKTGDYFTSPLWNGWVEDARVLTGVGSLNGGSQGVSFLLPGLAFIDTIEVTFYVEQHTPCHTCGNWFCVCCDCGECARCLYEPCCEYCCCCYECHSDGYCGCCNCDPCMSEECCFCMECPGCEICFFPCCGWCCKQFGECEGACRNCCSCTHPSEPCDECLYCTLCRWCYNLECTCIPCDDCDKFPCECRPTFLLDLIGNEYGEWISIAGAIAGKKSINPGLIKGVRFTFEMDEFECDGEHWYTYNEGSISETEKLDGCMYVCVYGPIYESKLFCYKDKKSHTYEFEADFSIWGIMVHAVSVFEGNNGRVLIEVLGEKGVVLRLGQQELCKCCETLVNPGKPGHVLGGEKIAVGDALEILKNIVGMENRIDKCNNAWDASRIVTKKGKPKIADALEILKHLVGMKKL